MTTMKSSARHLSIEGIPKRDLDLSLEKIEELRQWALREKIDRWAFRAALLKALNEDANEYFELAKGTFREIAAFDNGVAVTLESLGGGEKEEEEGKQQH